MFGIQRVNMLTAGIGVSLIVLSTMTTRKFLFFAAVLAFLHGLIKWIRQRELQYKMKIEGASWASKDAHFGVSKRLTNFMP